ncbi:MAG: GNAT family N-acetyltransferase [Pseudomonadota bacterium]
MLRRLTLADAAEYRELMIEAHASAPEAFTTSLAERRALPLAWWQQRLSAQSDAPEAVFGALQAGSLVAAAGLRREARERARHKAILFGLFVRAAARGQGLGEALVHAVLDHARSQQGVLQVQLTVTEGNATAIRLYERCGFASYGVEPMAVRLGEQYLDKRLLWRPLHATTG